MDAPLSPGTGPIDSHLEPGSPQDAPPRPGTGHTASGVSWPAGPHYFDLTGSEGPTAWVRYRVWSADWHTRTLLELAGPSRSVDRHVGVEMALDGILNGLSSAFDAGVALLIRAAEDALDIGFDDRLPVHQYRWERCRDLLKGPDLPDDHVWRLILDVDNALAGERDTNPSGWLAQLRRLRNQIAHQDSLARNHTIGEGQTTLLSIRGQAVDAVDHLADLCDRVHDLTEQMIRVAVGLGAPSASTAWHRGRWSDGH